MNKADKKVNKILLIIVLSASLGFLAVEWVSLMIPHRIMLTAKLLLFAVSLTLGILSPKFGKPKKSKHKSKSHLGFFREICFSIAIALFLALLFDAADYSYIQDFPFWLAALIITLAPAVLLAFLLPQNWFRSKSGMGWILLGVVILIAVLWVIVQQFIAHLNYVLDLTPPTEYTAIIEDKHTHHNRKSPDTYEFEITVDGETFDLEVNWLIYDDYEIGDTFSFYRYNGAFDKPFYLSDPSYTKGGAQATK